MAGTTLILFCAGAVLAAAVGGYLFVRLRRNKEEPVYHFRCPSCRRRLRYRERQVGHAGCCSHCGQHFTFPPVSQSMD